MPIQTVSQAFSNEGVGGFSFRNKIINGAMEIDQRNAGASVSIGNTYTLDRWQARTTTGSGHTVIQSSTVPTGFSKSLLFTVGTGASQGSTDQNRLFHYIEGSNLFDLQWGTSAAKTVTLSFWVRSSLTGTFGGSLINNAFDRSYPFSYSISAANTWEYKTITIAGDTSGTWTMGNSIGVAVCWNLGSGTSKVTTAGSWASGEYLGSTGNTVITATSGATWAITGAQFEIGSVATPFERRPIALELELCQRYYESSYSLGVLPGNAGSAIQSTSLSAIRTTAYILTYLQYKVVKRGTPTLTLYDNAGNINKCTRDDIAVGSSDNQTITSQSPTTLGAQVYSSGTYNATGIVFNYTASAEL